MILNADFTVDPQSLTAFMKYYWYIWQKNTMFIIIIFVVIISHILNQANFVSNPIDSTILHSDSLH